MVVRLWWEGLIMPYFLTLDSSCSHVVTLASPFVSLKFNLVWLLSSLLAGFFSTYLHVWLKYKSCFGLDRLLVKLCKTYIVHTFFLLNDFHQRTFSLLFFSSFCRLWHIFCFDSSLMLTWGVGPTNSSSLP